MNRVRVSGTAYLVVFLTGAMVFLGILGGMAYPGGGTDRKGFISGSEAARDILTECERGHGPCDTTLREANDRLRPMGLRIFEDGSVVQER